jgi:heme/copper-type cytochrome/quinol oxidase subunit 3
MTIKPAPSFYHMDDLPVEADLNFQPPKRSELSEPEPKAAAAYSAQPKPSSSWVVFMWIFGFVLLFLTALWLYFAINIQDQVEPSTEMNERTAYALDSLK